MLTWNFFKRYLFSQRSGALIRTISRLCIAGIAMGVMALIIVLSVMNGFNDAIKNRLLAVEPHIVVQFPGFKKGSKELEQIQKKLIKEGQEITGVESVSVVESQDVIIRTVEGLFSGAIARGMTPASIEDMLDRLSRSGRKRGVDFVMANDSNEKEDHLNADEKTAIEKLSSLKAGEIIMGADLAHSLRLLEGDQVTIIPPETLLMPVGEAPIFEKVTIKALISTHVSEIDNKLILYGKDRSLVRFKRSPSRDLFVDVRLNDPDDYDKIGPLFGGIGREIQTWVQRNQNLFFALRMEKLAMSIFLGLSFLITCFSIVTVLVLLMTQKRRDIGILMAMGLSPQRTRLTFAKVGMLLSGLGMGGGLIVGLAVCYVLDTYPIDLLPDIYYESSIPATVSPILVLLVIVASLVIAFLSAWVPVNKNVRMSPADSLRK